MIPTNEFQTALTDEFLESLDKEVREELLDYINNVKFISNLISPDRKRAKDLPKDEEGKIRVDLTNLHILEDMEYFRPAGRYFKENGCYTKLMPNNNPNSEFGKYLKQEIQRIWYGMVRPSDGEWIPGEMYFYLNYCPIEMTKVEDSELTNAKGKKLKRVRRITDLPEVWEGVYMMFHYLEQARQNNANAAIIARRGMSKSYMLAAVLARIFVCGNSSEESNNASAVIMANDKTFLITDGTLNKFVTNIDHCAKYTEFPRARYKSSLNDMNWVMGYIPADDTASTIEGTKNEVIGISAKNNPDKSRGKRCLRLAYEEFGKFPNFLETWDTNDHSVTEGDFKFGQQIAIGTGGTAGSDFSGALEMIYHPLGRKVYGIPNVFDKGAVGNTLTILFLGAYLNRKGYYNKDGVSDVVGALVSEIKERIKLKYNSSDPMAVTKQKAELPFTLQEAIMKRDSTIYPVAELNDRINELDNNPGYMDEMWVGRLSITGNNVVYTPDADLTPITIFPHKDNKLTGAVIIKELPQKDSSGNVPHGRYISGCLLPGEKVMTDSGLKNVEDVDYKDNLINKEGEYVKINQLLSYDKVDEEIYTVRVANTVRRTTFTKEHPLYVSKRKIKYSTKADRQRQYTFNFDFKTVDKVSVGDWIKVPNIYKRETKDYLNSPINKEYIESEDFWWFIGLWLGDGWLNKHKICIAFNKAEVLHINRVKKIAEKLFHRRPYIRVRNNCVELSFCYKELRDKIYNTFGQYSYAKRIPEWVKFMPAKLKAALVWGYLDADGCITHNNKSQSIEFVSVNLELLESIQDILFSLECVSAMKILSYEAPKRREKYSLSLTGYNCWIFRQLFNNPKDHKLSIITKYDRRNTPSCLKCFVDDNYIYFQITDISRALYTGRVYNFDCDTHTFMCYHITTHNCDPYDDDASNTLSLGSIYILDLYTDDIVFEYTGRPKFADDFYEICRRALLMYNARCNYENNKKGLFKYFSQHHCLHLLTDTLEFLKDKQMVKEGLYGNKVKGTNTNEHIKAYARRLIRDWLLKPIIVQQTVVGEGGIVTQEPITMPNLSRLSYRALLQELATWNKDQNFDRHDALGMLMLLRENQLMLLGEKQPGKEVEDVYYEGYDDFFTNNCASLKKQRQEAYNNNIMNM